MLVDMRCVGWVFIGLWITFLYLLDDRNLVVVANGVFTQEVKFHHTLAAVQLRVESDVFDSQWAAAHRVCRLPFLLLITSSQCQLFGAENTDINKQQMHTHPALPRHRANMCQSDGYKTTCITRRNTEMNRKHNKGTSGKNYLWHEPKAITYSIYHFTQSRLR